MASATVFLTVSLTLIVWRLVFGLQRRQSMREAAAPQRRDNNFFDPAAVVAIAGDHFVNNSHGGDLFERKDRAKTYLRRILALTGATQAGNSYILDVGRTRFRVRDGYVGRLRDLSNPKCGYDETCFSLPHNRMPSAAQIATALLQIKSNPALFDRWAAQCGAYKANGQGFS